MKPKSKRLIAIIAALAIIALIVWLLLRRCRRLDRQQADTMQSIQQRQSDINAQQQAASQIDTAVTSGLITPDKGRAALAQARRNPQRTLRTLERTGASDKLRDIRLSQANNKAILQAASQSMLAQSEQKHQDTLAPLQQANQHPASVLSLLQ